MKATVWLWPFVTTLLCASQFVCTAQREFQDYADTSLMEDDFLLTKRAKPSLSIANPLDVLRQRLLLETARRQMREKTRQVKLNREILDTVGKRANMKYNHFVDFLRDEDEDIINNNNNKKNNKKALSDDNDYQIRYLYSLQKNRYTRK